jgi:hypothetical protein
VVKFAGSYLTKIGVQVGAFYRWNSGAYASLTALDTSRNLPIQVPVGQEYEFNGATEQWIADNAVGSLQNPSWGQLDLRLEYKRRLAGLGTEVFVDIFNVSDNQTAIRNQDLLAGSGGVAFGEALTFNTPRRFFLGARLSF